MNPYMYPDIAKDVIVSYIVNILNYVSETNFLCPLNDIMYCE